MKLGIILPVVIAGAALACSGATDTGLFTGQPGASNSPSGNGPDNGDGEGQPDATVAQDSGDNGGPDGEKDSGDPRPDGGVIDAGNDVPPPVEGVWCGEDPSGKDVYCKSPEYCCVQNQGKDHTCNGGLVDLCGVASDGLRVECDSPADCKPNNVCCGERANDRYTSVTCKTSCSGVRFCNPTANDCGTRTCGPSRVLPGYYVCQ